MLTFNPREDLQCISVVISFEGIRQRRFLSFSLHFCPGAVPELCLCPGFCGWMVEAELEDLGREEAWRDLSLPGLVMGVFQQIWELLKAEPELWDCRNT